MNSAVPNSIKLPSETSADRTASADSKMLRGNWVLVRQANETSSVHRISVQGPSFVIGRHASSHLAIADPTVSSRHAEVVFVDGDLFIRDLNSTNGTLLNGRRIQTLIGLRTGDVLHFGSVMCTLQRTVDEHMTETVTTDASSDALAQLQFDKLLKRPALRPFFQPVVRLEDHSRVGFEVLSRSYLIGLETPEKMFRVAAQRTSEVELSMICRSEGLRVGESMNKAMKFYLNTHPAELKSARLFDSLTVLRRDYPETQIALEVHEAAVTSTSFLRDLRKHVNDLKIELAYDDFGAGQARLKELFDVPPDVLKFDIKFINGLPYASAQHRSTIQSLLNIVRDLGVIPLAEGVETAEEAICCFELGFELAQGFLFGRAESASYWATN